MENQYFYVSHKTGTYADALEAVGLAYLLDILMPKNVERIKNIGDCYQITLRKAKALDSWHFDRLQAAPGYPYFKTSKDHTVPEGYLFYDYEKEREKEKRYWENAKKTCLRQENILEPHPKHSLLKNLYIMQAFHSHNRLLHELSQVEPQSFRETIKANVQRYTITSIGNNVETGFSRGQEDTKRKHKVFSPSLAAVQALNPIVGKGFNRSKPKGTGLATVPSAYVDWFTEYLRYIAIHRIANAYNIHDDIKITVLVPANVTLEELDQLSHHFTRIPHYQKSSCQIDIQNSLAMTSEIVKDLFSSLDVGVEKQHKSPQQYIAALSTAYFKSLGTGKGLLNVSTIGLPTWFSIETLQDKELWLQIAREHRSILERLREERLEEAELLFQYRDFLSTGKSITLLHFAVAYGIFVFHEMSRDSKKILERLREELLSKLVISLNRRYSDIINNPGFQAVANAIRRATVSEQYRRARQQDRKPRPYYEVHYTLLTDLKRKAGSKKDAIARLSDFISAYNFENARITEIIARSPDSFRDEEIMRRPSITDQEITQLIHLIDDFGSEPVIVLLIAYGSAKKEG
ncbi:hypothetical protein [Heliorestis convoluta]|uniref:Uncharacterized protein n=1 Tax=Heliorestis convoluta TaxID=356322 RepID=A0A5Q2N0W2_9FIRM|nr:hypothetical protein [Heliorestis convoluta]QGG48984.1 hypothetical protein FTV88_2895 [Heliorestis convoluta]